jgi:DNA-binding NtrC family response regulator
MLLLNMASIVVVDSDETVRRAIVSILESAGHAVRATGEFNEALVLLHTSLADLVLTDVFLRGTAGHDAMVALRRKFPDLRVLMVSGLPDEEAIQAWTGEPRFDVFLKPFTCDSLLGKVRQMMAFTSNT